MKQGVKVRILTKKENCLDAIGRIREVVFNVCTKQTTYIVKVQSKKAKDYSLHRGFYRFKGSDLEEV